MSEKRKLICPHCNVATSFYPVRITGLGELTEESLVTRVVRKNVQLEAYTRAPSPREPGVNYAILECQACSKFFIAKGTKYPDEGWSAVYPIPHTPVDAEIPRLIRVDLEEAELCFAVRAYKACVQICATVVDATWKDQQVTSLKELEERGSISNREFKQADQVRRWGNVLKHVPILEPVETEEAEQLLGYVREILHSIYVKDKKFKDLASRLRKRSRKEDS